MRIIMKDLPIKTIPQVEEFLKVNQGLAQFEIESNQEKYNFTREILLRFRYNKLSKNQKGLILRFLKYFTNYSKSHLKRLIKLWKKGNLRFKKNRKRNKFSVKYFATDIALLIETDVAHDCLSAEATKRILKREFRTFKNEKYENISKISVSHIYNIRNQSNQYNSSEAKNFKRTQATQVNIGKRKKPRPNGKPGYLRVDTVHQGDKNGEKGVYHINMVDEVTQYEMIASVEKITERYLKPVVKALLKLFPFNIYEFHSDNGSEYINKITAKLLNKLHIELTKSRSRHSNDNALVESKNGSIIRKMYGRNYISQKYAIIMNEFNQKYVNIYLNYHRPCGFAEDRENKKGKIVKKYTEWVTPYDKLKSLKNADKYLKKGITFKKLDQKAYEESDNEFAKKMQKEKKKLFKKIKY